MSCVTCHEWIFILLLVFLSVQGYNLRLLQRAHSRHVQSFARGLSSRPLSVLQDEKIESKVAPEYGNIIFTVAIKGKLQLELFQHTKAKIPRSYLPAILKLHVSNDQNPSDEEVLSLLQESILWYVEQGGKFTNMNIVCNRDQFAPLLNSGFVPSHSGSHDEFFYHPKIDQAISDFEQRTSEDTKKLFEQANIIGRLYHEHGLPLKSIDWLTKALSYNPRSSATFRNLGSSYLAAGQKKMAFASFQQAIELDPTGMPFLNIYKYIVLKFY